MEVRRLFLIEQAKYENEMIMYNFLKQLCSSTTTTTQVVTESNILYGLLYNWYAVNDAGGIAPDGWRIPTDDDWTDLTNELGAGAGGAMKTTGTLDDGTGLWTGPNTGPRTRAGFRGFPGAAGTTSTVTTTSWETTATGGALRSPPPPMPGSAGWTTSMRTCSASTTIRKWVSRFVASVIPSHPRQT